MICKAGIFGWLYKSSALLLVVLVASVAHAGDRTAAKKEQLAQVKARIAKVEKTLDKAIDRRGNLTSELRDIESALGEAQGALRETTRDIDKSDAKLDQLKRSRIREKDKLDKEKAALGAQISAAYEAGRRNRLKLILNQEDPAEIQRMLAYYGYFNQARTARIEAFKDSLDRLARLKDEIAAKLTRLANLKRERQDTLDEIESRRDARKKVLAKVNASINQRQSKLATLKRNKRQLERLIERLSRALADIPGNLDSQTFASLRGQLSWPVAGPHLASYGAKRADGRLRWEGVLIGGKAGEPVHAIAHGRVVYAGWLPHFGLLLIIDHGGGYMSLYAHNQSLYREVGDWVRAGEAIATLGDTGGQSRDALYFEIRHDKKPVKPGLWCR